MDFIIKIIQTLLSFFISDEESDHRNVFNFIISSDDTEIVDSILTKFILDKCDTIAWTNYGRTSMFGPKWEKDPEFIEQMEHFQSELIKKTLDNIECGEMIHKRSVFNHYFFKLSGNVKKFVEEQGVISVAPGFWDPIYFKGKKMVAAVIAHEPIVMLNLTDNEAEKLHARGVKMYMRDKYI